MSNVYQLKIILEGSEPVIWRSVQVQADTSLYELHEIIQVLMDWEDYHMFSFEVNGNHISELPGEFEPEEEEADDKMSIKLSEEIRKVGDNFIYTYGHENNWRMLVEVERMMPDKSDAYYPVCTAGENASPPEDTGGIIEYVTMLAALSDPKHKEHKDAVDWLGGDWDAEFFDLARVNRELLRINSDSYPDEYGLRTYDDVKNLNKPTVLLDDEIPAEGIHEWLEAALNEEGSLEHSAMTRLRDKGLDEFEAMAAIAGAMAVEWYYYMKHGVDQLDERYRINLERLPEQPLEVPDLEHAVQIIEQATYGIPIEAIEYLRNQPTENVLDIIVEGLEKAYDRSRFYKEETNQWMSAPLFYAIAAEAHTHERLIEPVFGLYLTSPYATDFIHEQGNYLLSQLSEKYRDIVVPKVIEAAHPDSPYASGSIIYLYDGIQYADPAKYGAQILAVLENPDTPIRDQWAHAVANLQLKEAIPMIKAIIRKREAVKQRRGTISAWWEFHDIIEYKEALEKLESGESKFPAQDGPNHLNRGDWREYYKQWEDRFYDQYEAEEDDEEDEDEEWGSWPIVKDNPVSKMFKDIHQKPTPYIKEKKPGRNDPCYCGSDKKYKKCCMKKDEAVEEM
ncbi:MAG: SEC-C metal-binding domain-containing protein [Bacteroidia bacterium]